MNTSRTIASSAAVGLVVFLVVLGLRALMPAKTVMIAPHAPKIAVVAKKNIPAGWSLLDQPAGFSLHAPPGTSHHRDHGIDWSGGQFDGTEFSFGYYIGLNPQPLHGTSDPPFTEEKVTIDERQGILQRFTYPAAKNGRRYYSRLLLRDAFQRYDFGDSKPALDLYGRAASPGAQADMERMWRSIRFDGRRVKDLAPVHGGN